MRKIKPLITTSFLALTIISTPFAALADSDKKSNEDKKHGQNGISVRASVMERIKGDKTNWPFGLRKKIALATTTSSTTNPAPSGYTRAKSTPVIQGIKSPTVLSVDQTGTWEIKAYDPQNKSLSYAVDWGDTANMSLKTMSEPVFSQTASFEHAYASAGTYKVKFTVKNELGLQTSSSVTVHVLATNNTAPVISDLKATSTRMDRAVVNWKTDVKADSQLWYSTTTPVNTSREADIIRKSQTVNHALTIKNLTASTTYYVVVGSKNKNGMVTMSSQTSFTTPAPVVKNLPPVISSVTGPANLAQGTLGTWDVSASDPEDKSLSYAVDWGDAPTILGFRLSKSEPVFAQTASFDHVYSKAGTYDIKFTVKDELGLETSSSTKVTVTPGVPVVITNVAASSTVSNKADISWKTDKESDSHVWIGTSLPVNISGDAMVSDDEFTLDHKLNVTNLTASTTYHAVVGSRDENDILSTSSISFTTPASEIVATSTTQ